MHETLHTCRSKVQNICITVWKWKRHQRQEKIIILKADGNVLQCLVTAYEAGRPVALQVVLKNELLPVPESFVEMNDSLRTFNKYVLSVLKLLKFTTHHLASLLMDKHLRLLWDDLLNVVMCTLST